jgi:dihydroorotate dehydrogenase electron transfer subunit
MPKELTGEVLYQECLHEDCYRMVIRAEPAFLEEAQPGQFIHLKVNEFGGPLLRRPFSIHQVNRDEQTLSLLYAVVGQGTRIMAADLPGKKMSLLGPLGTGFPSLDASVRHVMLVGGGLGAAPLLFAAERLCQEGKKVEVILGFPSRDRIMLLKDFQQTGAVVSIATDDGSEGFAGYPTTLLEQQLKENRKAVVFACGPHAMLENVASVCGEADVSAWISMEERMACGIGACLGCVVRIRDDQGGHYKKACKDGPVFKASEVNFDES